MPPSSTPQGASDPPTSAPSCTNTTITKDKNQTQPQNQYSLSANFAHDPKAPAPYTINYDQEVYLQLITGDGEAGDPSSPKTKPAEKKNKNKTPTQIYREEWVRRALNPAISDPRGDPSPIDFECAESQRVRERF
ncbi:hypothetical protein BDV12DRAFT_199897 [Aspergillus spectabilis]